MRTALWVNRLGSIYLFYVFCVLVAGVLWQTGEQSAAMLFVHSVIVMSLVVFALKLITRVPRPEGVVIKISTHSFPSGHSAAVALLVVMMPYIASLYFDTFGVTLVALFFIAVALFVTTSRLTLRAHTRLQVLVGIFIGLAVPAVTLLF